MAVQAQYPSNILLLNRNLQDGKNINDSQPGHGDVFGGYLDQSQMVFNNNEVGTNPRKRSREITPPTTTTIANMNTDNLSLEKHQQIHRQRQQQHRMINLSQLQNHHHQQQYQNNNNVVSTGLRLSFGEQQQKNEKLPSILSLLPQHFSLQFKQQSDEINFFIHSQTDQLRRTLAEKRQKHYRALLVAAEESTTRHLRQNQAELEKATKQNAELTAQLAQLTEEAQSWRAKVEAQEAHSAQIQAQIHQAIKNNGAQQQDKEMVGLKCTGDEVEDSESVYGDPVSERRVDSACCKVCRSRDASVVLLPCRHLCVCSGCDEVVKSCPVCCSRRSYSVEVYFS